MLPEKAQQEFKDLYQKIYGKELSKKETAEKASRLLNFYKAVYVTDETKGQLQINKQKNER